MKSIDKQLKLILIVLSILSFVIFTVLYYFGFSGLSKFFIVAFLSSICVTGLISDNESTQIVNKSKITGYMEP